MASNHNAVSYSTAIREVRRVHDWVWPHRHVVYPVERYRPVLDTPEQRKGRKMLKSVLCYLETCAAVERGETERVFYHGVRIEN